MDILPIYLPQPLYILIVAIVACVAGAILGRLLMSFIKWLVKTNPKTLEHVDTKRLHAPLYTVLPVLAVFVAVRAVAPELMNGPVMTAIVKITSVALIYWLALRIIDILSKAMGRRYDITVSDNLRARSIHTQISVIKSIASFLIFLIALAAIFLMFDTLRGIGVSLLASAGVAGLVVGLAAQKTLGNLFAGIQIAFTQPIRLEDVVVVENEWGRVEEITLTYVVIRIWDLRRLVLPISYFLEKPFQNWTRQSADIIGAVEIFADYTMPIEPLREKLTELLKGNALWDQKTQGIQVTDCTADVIKIRILVSSADSSASWDLRCYVREAMVQFIQTEYPQCLPKTRAALESLHDDDHRDNQPAGRPPEALP
ncbi:MAG: mechanosensitive ion channel domain-containing protein [Asticcacaulis sp.]